MNLWQGVAHLLTSASIGSGWREQLINILMPIFFYYIGHEIRLATKEKATSLLAPTVAAIGGMVIPAAIFLALSTTIALPSRTFGVTMATDLPLALAALALFPKAVSARVRHFILVLAVADDLGSILVLAIGFNKHFSVAWILGQIAVIAAIHLFRKNSYVLLLVPVGWWISLHSGFQPTVIAALMGVIVTTGSRDFYFALEKVSYFVCIPVFLFALLSDGFSSENLAVTSMNSYSYALLAARVIGKPIGIILGAWLAHRFWRAPSLDINDLALVGTLGIFGLSVSMLFLHLSTGQSETIAHGTTAIIYINAVAAIATAGWRYFFTRLTAA